MSFPIHARYAHPEAGWEDDRKRAAEALTPGEVYTIRTLTVGSSTSYMTFQEVDGKFNTVLFDPAGGWQEELDEVLVPRVLTAPLTEDGSAPLLDPDCRSGKHAACAGDPCECECHTSGIEGVAS